MIINLCRLSHIRVIVTAKKIKPKIQLHFINIVIVNLRLTGDAFAALHSVIYYR